MTPFLVYMLFLLPYGSFKGYFKTLDWYSFQTRHLLAVLQNFLELWFLFGLEFVCFKMKKLHWEEVIKTETLGKLLQSCITK